MQVRVATTANPNEGINIGHVALPLNAITKVRVEAYGRDLYLFLNDTLDSYARVSAPRIHGSAKLYVTGPFPAPAKGQIRGINMKPLNKPSYKPKPILHLDASNPKSYPGTGNVWYDLSGNGNNATLYSTTASNGFINFNGGSSYGQVPNGVYFDGGDFTIQSWISSSAPTNAWSRVVDFGNGALNDNVILVASSHGRTAQPMLSTYQGGAGTQFAANQTVQANKWVNVAATYNSATKTGHVYMNGQLVGTMHNQLSPRNVTRTANFIGRSNWGADALFAGSMKSIEIYGRFFTAADMAAYASLSSWKTLTMTGGKTVQVSDALGAPVSGADVTLGFFNDSACSISTGAASVSATTSTAGLATFSSWNAKTDSGYYYRASSGPFNSACISNFAFTTQPSGSIAAGWPLTEQPVIRGLDRLGSPISGTVTLAAYTDPECSCEVFASGIGSATATVAGVATFSGVKSTGKQSVYLQASAGKGAAWVLLRSLTRTL